MFIKRQRHGRWGYTLVEVMVASGLFGIVSAAVMTTYMFSTQGFVSLANYAELDKINRAALDTLTKEIREARVVTAVSSNSLGTVDSISLINGNGVSVTYYFNESSKELVRSAGDGSSQVLLTSCDLLNFNLYQRNPAGSTSFDIFPQATPPWTNTVKVVSLTWKASRPIPGTAGTKVSENIQTARVVIRKQQQN